MKTLGERLRQIRGDTARDRYAPSLGVSLTTIANYENGLRVPDAAFLVKVLGLHPHINPTWLLTGEGPQERRLANVPAGAEVPIDPELLAAVIAAVEEHLALVRKRLHPDKKAQLIITLYDLFSDKEEKTVDRAAVISLIKLAA
jgi:transcriptional regulator with XRE-family HTH domain